MTCSLTTGVLSGPELQRCRDALSTAIGTKDKTIKPHLGTSTIPRERCPDDVRGLIDRVAGRAVRVASRFTGTPLRLEYADITRRPQGAGMGMHVDDAWYPNRIATAVLPLHTIPPDRGGQTVVRFGRREAAFDHVAGRLLVFPSKHPHWVRAPAEDRDVMLLWLEAA